MKRKLLILATVLCLLLTFTLTACVKPVAEYTVTFYDNDGKTVLSTAVVKEGEKPQRPADPTKEGHVFKGWFITPTNKTEFDFDATVTEDKAAYAQWTVDSYADSRDWVLVGTMESTGWDAEKALHFTKKADSGNIFEVTVDILQDDKFKMTVLNEDGILDYNNAGGADVGFGNLVEPGETFIDGGGLGSVHDIVCTVEGNYTLTMTTDPENSNITVAWKRNGDIVAPPVEHVIATYAIKGSKVTGWADKTDDMYLMTKGDDGKFTLEIELYANDEVMFVAYEDVDGTLTALTKYIKSDILTADSASQIAAKTGGNFTTSANGTYTFVFDPDANTVKVTYSEEFTLAAETRPTTWYILGNGDTPGSVLNIAAWGLNDEAKQQLADKGNGVYEITLDLYVGDQFKICSNASWGNEHAYKYIVEPGENFEDAGNVKVLVEGNYTLKLTIDAEDETKDKIEWVRNGDAAGGGEVVEPEIYAYAIKGSKITGWADKTDDNLLMKKGEDGKYTLEIELYANDEFMFVAYEQKDGALSALTKYVKSDVLAEGSATQVAAKGGNLTTSANGTYTFVYDPAANTLTVSYSDKFTQETPARPTTWYILGNGATDGSVLKISAWGLNDETKQKLTDKGNGVYEITLNLYENDEFQICSNGSWADKHGFDSIVEPGENFAKGGNVTVKVAGNYTLTLTIDANDETKDTITWVRNGDCN